MGTAVSPCLGPEIAFGPIDLPGGSSTVATYRRKEVKKMMMMIASLLDLRPRDGQKAQGLAEYALILALIAIVAIVALLFLGTQISSKLSIVGSAV